MAILLSSGSRVLAGLMIFGSQRAPDHLFRVIGGIVLILVVIPVVLA